MLNSARIANPARSGVVTTFEIVLYFLKLGTVGFGGPVVLCEHMRRDLVEKRGWITPAEYSEGFSLSQLAPGPLAAQLAIYLGWVRRGVLGATLAGIAFVLPSFFMVLALSALYIAFGGLSWIQGAFYGIGAAVIGIMAQSSYRLVTKTFRRDWLIWSVGAISAAVTMITETEWLLLFLAAGISVMLVRRKESIKNYAFTFPWLITGLNGPATSPELKKIFLFFCKAGAVVFGSGLAIVPFLHGGVVAGNHWLTERQFLDSVAVAMITPGPIVITVAFIGYLVAGPLGAVAAALGVFLPCYLFVIFPAPYYNRFSKNLTMRAFVDGVTAAAVGAIVGAVVVLGRRAILDWVTLLLFLTVVIALWKLKRIPEPVFIFLAGIFGILVKSI
ncbi:MAG: chromate transporter [Bdellovibrionota bacterium]